MKKELLRIHNLNYRYNQAEWLENITLCILEGECVGFFGLSNSGKNLLVRILTGQTIENVRPFWIFLDGKRMTSSQELKKEIYYLSSGNYQIGEWTVAEYIGLVGKGCLWTSYQKNRLEGQIQMLAEEMDVDLDVSEKLSDLTEVEKRTVDLVKACRQGAKVLIIEDEFDGMSERELRKFASILHRTCMERRIAAIINSHSDMVMNVMSDKCIIFKKGRIVKKCSGDFITSKSQLELFLLDKKITTQKANFDHTDKKQILKQESGNQLIYEINNFRKQDGTYHRLKFCRGQITTVLMKNDKEKMRLFLILSGRGAEPEVEWKLKNQKLKRINVVEFVEKRIVSVIHLGSKEEILDKMTMGENLLLPSLKKLSFMEYSLFSHKLLKSIHMDMEGLELQMDHAAGSLEINESIIVTLQRWYTYNPRVLVLLEPFAQCDIYGVSIVKAYIKRFAERGTSVIILKAREEYIEDLSDYVINL